MNLKMLFGQEPPYSCAQVLFACSYFTGSHELRSLLFYRSPRTTSENFGLMNTGSMTALLISLIETRSGIGNRLTERLPWRLISGGDEKHTFEFWLAVVSHAKIIKEKKLCIFRFCIKQRLTKLRSHDYVIGIVKLCVAERMKSENENNKGLLMAI